MLGTVLAAPVSTTPVSAGLEPSGRYCARVPVGGAGDLAIVNLTPVDAAQPGSGQIIPSDVVSPPVASNVNFAPGTVDPNTAIARIGDDGEVCFVNSVHGTVEVVIDLLAVVADGSYTPTTTGAPVRLVDTRIGTGGSRIAADERLCFATGAPPGSLALINLTPVGATQAGFGVLTTSSQTTRPAASNVNFGPGTVDPNLAVAQVGTGGAVCFWNSDHGSVDVVADLLGSIDPGSFSPPLGGGPRRLADTRASGGRIQPNERRCFVTDESPGDLVMVNLTPVGASAPGSGLLETSDPATSPTRPTSNVNFGPGTVDPNVAVARVGVDRAVCFRNSEHASVDLVADLLATIAGLEAVDPPVGTPLPVRLADSRPSGARVVACLSAANCVGADPQLAFSRDGGSTWRLSQSAVPWPMLVDEFQCRSAVICVAGGHDVRRSRSLFADRYALVTLDAGATWRKPANVGLADDLACPPTSATLATCLVVGDTGTVTTAPTRRAAITTDGGRSWRDVPLPDAGFEGTRLEGLACSADTCRSFGSRRSGADVVPTVVTFTTTDGWATVTVTET